MGKWNPIDLLEIVLTLEAGAVKQKAKGIQTLICVQFVNEYFFGGW